MANIVLLDGGMGQELVRRSGDTPTALWSTRVMMDHPGLVADVHRDFFAAGATVATTNSYAVHRDRLDREGLDPQFETLLRASVHEATEARKAAPGTCIAGSIGPLGASYRPDLHPPHDEAVRKYTEVVQVIGPHVDLILCETVASAAHARAVLEAARTSGLPVWLAFTLSDEDGSKLRSGEPVSAALAVAEREGAAAVLANCSVPEAMSAAMEVFATGKLPFGAYANAFTHISDGFLTEAPTVDALGAREDLGPVAYAAFARKWVQQGATIVGGCCEVGPAHIRELGESLLADGHELVAPVTG